MRLAPLLLLCLVAAAPAKEKPPTFEELRVMVRRLTADVARLKAEVADLQRQVKLAQPKAEAPEDEIKRAIANDQVIVGMTEAQLETMLAKFREAGTIMNQGSKDSQFKRGGKVVRRTVYWAQVESWGLPKKTITVEDGIVVEID
jgi:outer membrane murein-binding lipoprotein Lpp